MNIDKFKREHVDLLTAVTALRELVQAGVQEHAEAIVGQLVTMSSVINCIWRPRIVCCIRR